LLLLPDAALVLQFVGGADLKPMTLDEELYYLFGGGFLGYTGARTWEKAGGKKLLGG
jgi:hypothetical protein